MNILLDGKLCLAEESLVLDITVMDLIDIIRKKQA